VSPLKGRRREGKKRKGKGESFSARQVPKPNNKFRKIHLQRDWGGEFQETEHNESKSQNEDREPEHLPGPSSGLKAINEERTGGQGSCVCSGGGGFKPYQRPKTDRKKRGEGHDPLQGNKGGKERIYPPKGGRTNLHVINESRSSEQGPLF